MFIGLMGVSDSGMLITPKGNRLFRVPMFAAIIIQRIQHKIAQVTWRKIKEPKKRSGVYWKK